MGEIREHVERHGWHVGTLIHDAIVVEAKEGPNQAEKEALEKEVQRALREAVERRGWDRGTARAKVTAY